MTLSAKGTRLNRRGLETRRHLLKVALSVLAQGGPEAVSANLIAREAGVTWGTVQHQFGDADGLWAGVLEYVAEHRGPVFETVTESSDVAGRVSAVVAAMWASLDLPGQKALYNLRKALPRERGELESQYPKTAAAIANWDGEWTAMCEAAFEGLDVDRDRLARVRALLPGAIRGVREEQYFSSYADTDAAKQGLVDALSLYLA
ncbi:TetR/AcrR family transcriptional regulator [Nocardioides sp. Bht2]|uniref:TetR/AcrR family transcriptional regulator n=1 Tax=Nocardioides sp. Bht2 TaxID=3392297 RepID=UPI0039B3A874